MSSDDGYGRKTVVFDSLRGVTAEYWLNNRQRKWLLHGQRASFLERPVSIFLGHLSHQRDSPLNRSIQILARRMPFDKTDIRPIVLS
jgi:hypothetical protein